MCAIGRNLDTSVGAQAPATTMLGAPSIGGSTGSGPKRVAGGAAIGTLLTAGAAVNAPVGGGNKPSVGRSTPAKNQMQR